MRALIASTALAASLLLLSCPALADEAADRAVLNDAVYRPSAGVDLPKIEKVQLLLGVGGGSRTPYVGLSATRLSSPRAINTGIHNAMFSTGHVATSDMHDVVVCFSNVYLNSGWVETAPGGASTVTASIEYPPTVSIDVLLTFSGSGTGTIADKAVLCSDDNPLPTMIPKGAAFNVREYVVNAAGMVTANVQNTSVASLIGGNAAGDAYHGTANATGNPDLTNSVSAITNNGGGSSGAPLVIASTITDPSVGVIGDSIAAGALAPSHNIDFRDGDVVPSFPTTVANLNLAQSGAVMQNWASVCAVRCAAAYPYIHDFVIQGGTNDIHVSAVSAATLQGYIQTLIAALPAGSKSTVMTLLAEPSSTDGYTTTANQSADSKQGVLDTYNALVIAGSIAGNNNGYFDIRQALQTSGKWNLSASARTASDCSITTGTKVLTSPTLSFSTGVLGSSGDTGVEVFVTGAAAASANLVTNIATVTNSTTAQTAINAGTTVSAVACKVGGINIGDGTHLNDYGNAAVPLSGVIDSSKFVYP